MTWFQWLSLAVLAALLWTNGRITLRKMRENERGKVGPKTLLSIAIAIVMVAVFVYGLLEYPDAPIRPCTGSLGFCGKQNQPHSLLEYRQFLTWQAALVILWPLGLLSLFLLNRKRLKLDSDGTT